MDRTIFKALEDWKTSQRRKVLLVRGARQVGKTYAVRTLSRTFKRFLEVDLEAHTEVHQFFEGTLEPRQICEKLGDYFGEPIREGETLLFLDELQACPRALSALRYFYEKMPGLHVIGAGSLLEFALDEIPSQGVGRVTSMHMYPMSLFEFLQAQGEEGLIRALRKASPDTPLDNAFHVRLNDYLRTYLLIGGMPEVVLAYRETKQLRECQDVLSDLIVTFRDDFAKYRKRVPTQRLQEVFESIPHQGGGKFVYSRVNPAIHSLALRDALELLIKAGLACRIVHTNARGLPLGAQVNPKRFKVNLVDIGLHQRLLGLDISAHVVASGKELVNRGCLAEMFAAQELRCSTSWREPAQQYYWHRESRSSNAEVDLVIQHAGKVVPIEIKAGKRGAMQSMRLFMKERDLGKGIRSSMEPFGKLPGIDIVPLYALREYVMRSIDDNEREPVPS